MGLLTLLDIAKQNGSDPVAGLIDETATSHPEVSGQVTVGVTTQQIPNVGAARTINGLFYKTLIRTGLPQVGFRSANQGTPPTKATHENRLVETFIMNPQWRADKAVADRHEDGPEAVIALEASAHMEGANVRLGSQFYYGTVVEAGGHAKGYPGLIQGYDAANMVVDADGEAEGTGSSVWAVKFGPKNVIWVWGNDGQLMLSDVTERDAEDDDGNKFTAYFQELTGYPGLQIGSLRSVGRIKKLTEENGCTLTDALVASLLNKFPAGIRPDVLFMNRRSHGQLQASRTATNATGAPAPFPTESHGVPIAVTDSISSTESLDL